MQTQQTKSTWESQDVADMRSYCRLAIKAAHDGKGPSSAYFLNQAQHSAIRAGWERYSEEYKTAAHECRNALEGR